MRAIVFDFDGTLVDTETPELNVWNEVFAEHGVTMPEGYWASIVGRGAEQEYERPKELLERLTGQPFENDRDRHGRTMRLIAAEPLRPGVLALLEEARAAGTPCAVASSSRHSWVDPALAERRIDDFFETVVCADDVARAKPFPDLYLEACRRLGVAPEAAVAIEDSLNGMRAALAAGLATVVTPNPTTAAFDFSGATLQIDDLRQTNLAELRALVQRKLLHG